MTAITMNGWVQLGLYIAALTVLAKPLGGFMASVYRGKRTFLSPVFGWLERGLYKLSGIDPAQEMDWKRYALSVIGFSAVSFLGVYATLRLQGSLGLNPASLPGLSPHLAFNTAASFITNTDWQSYGSETTMSHVSQMAALTVQNFLSAATGMAVLIALIRGFTRKHTDRIGNFWVDLVRGNLYILLPLSLILALLLASQGVVQTFAASIEATNATAQTIAVGPAASQIAIKQLGTNGGGFFNVNAAHPLENPTPFSNFLEMLAILLIPVALCYTFGTMVGDTRQGRALLLAMAVVFIPIMLLGVFTEQQGNPLFTPLGIDQAAGNMEGKETRFGVVNSALWAAATTAASNGSVNAMHDSFTPLGGLIPMLFIQFGEVIGGGVGSGLYGMLIFVIITVFTAGLMVGRTPEYLGKKINAFEVKMASLVILVPTACVLLGTTIAVLTKAGTAGVFNPYAQGFSEALYAFTSASHNNGSAFAGLSANTPFYTTALGICMLMGRFFVMLPVLAIAGSLAAKNTVPPSAGTLPTHTPLFIFMLVAIIIMVGALTYIPALALGPVAEHFHLMEARQ